MPDANDNLRLEPHPTHLLDRSTTVAFEFDGKRVEAYEGDTLASALYATGRTTFSRSFKYHRPRGLLCVAGRCPNCLMTVDGVPNVRACTELVRQGMIVRHQNAWPSIDRDFVSILDKMDRFMPVGFYYKTFHRPKLLWTITQPIIRRVAGLGSLEVDSPPETHYNYQHQHTDVAVVGGGPAGMSAAVEAANYGARVSIIDDQSTLGGSLRLVTRTCNNIPEHAESPGFEIANALVESVQAQDRIQVRSNSTVFGLYQDNLLGVLDDRHLVKLRAKRVVIATGSQEVPLVFQKNDLPGVMLTTAAQRLIRLHGVKPGSTAVIATTSDQGYDAALDLLDAGVYVAAVVDSRSESGQGVAAVEALKSRGTPIFASHAVLRAEGKKKVNGAVVGRLQDGLPVGEERRFRCDVICMSGGFQPSNALLYQDGCQLSYDEALGETVPRELSPSLDVAGEVTGIHDLRVSILQGKLAGAVAVASLGSASSGPNIQELRRLLTEAEESYRGSVRVGSPPIAVGEGKKQFICVCEDITAKDVARAIDEGFGDIQTLKRYSTVTMGPCQGKMCLKSFVGVSAQHTGLSIDETGVTTARPPFQPVPMGALAGPGHIPIKRTPMDHKNQELGAPMVDLGPWRRAYSYSTPHEESIAVHERVGIIDVTTLGKLDVRGKGAPTLLDKVYTHHFANLRPGRIRYGILCADNGSIIDDGTVTRLAEDRYFVTTTTGNIELIEEWFKWWMAGTGMCAHVTDVTSAYAAINVAGPKARDTLNKLTDLDLSPTAHRYMRSAQGTVAGVPALLLKIGFVGESGWEIHFPSEYGEYVWDSLMDAGEEFGIAPFGLEAQRILRLEKKHIIVNQDTDSISNPLESDVGWAVRFDKEDFIGRGGLQGVVERGLRDMLVGFIMRDGLVPADGVPVVSGGKPIGRVTSSRMSPTLGKAVGLAWVPVDIAEDGNEIMIMVDGKPLPAQITMAPFYDPEGKRLRE